MAAARPLKTAAATSDDAQEQAVVDIMTTRPSEPKAQQPRLREPGLEAPGHERHGVGQQGAGELSREGDDPPAKNGRIVMIENVE